MQKPSLKEQVGTAINTSDLSSRPHESAVDRIAALGLSDPLGAALWRLRVGGDLRALKPAAVLLARRAREGFAENWKIGGAGVLLRVCRQILNEWLQDNCQACKGRGLVGLARGGVKVERKTCQACQGTGYLEKPVPRLRRAKKDGVFIAGRRVVYDPRTIEVPKAPCQDCAGMGWKFVQDDKKATKERACKKCKGTGKRDINHAARARVVGVSRVSYHRHWEAKFAAVRQLIRAHYQEEDETVLTVLRGERE